MDEVKITSLFTRKIIAGIIEKVIRKKTGNDVRIMLNDFTLTIDHETAAVHIDINASTPKNNFQNLMDLVRRAI